MLLKQMNCTTIFSLMKNDDIKMKPNRSLSILYYKYLMMGKCTPILIINKPSSECSTLIWHVMRMAYVRGKTDMTNVSTMKNILVVSVLWVMGITINKSVHIGHGHIINIVPLITCTYY